MRSAILAGLLLLPACGPDDGVLSLSFGLAVVADLELPDPAEAGVELDPLALAAAGGRCDGDVAGGRLECAIAGLPRVASDPEGGPHWRMTLLFGDHAISPQASGHTHGLSSATEVIDVGRVTPTALGTIDLIVVDRTMPLERTLGGAIELAWPVAGAEELARARVLEGTVGNLEDEQGDPAAGGGGGGHEH